MTEMRIGLPAADLRTHHVMAGIDFFLNTVFTQRASEAWPAAAGIVFITGAEQGLSRNNIHVNSLIGMIPILSGKGSFSSVILRYFVLNFVQAIF
ncbi:hypothetical protein D3C81_2007390 [compost metagenome]